MAGNGREGERDELKRIVFRDAAGKQKSLRLGECSERNATLALSAIDHPLEAKQHDTAPHYDAVRWLERIDDRIHARVVALGLAQPRGAAVVTLGTLLVRFDEAAAVKASIRAVYRQTTNSLRASLGGSLVPARVLALPVPVRFELAAEFLALYDSMTPFKAQM